MNDTFIDNTFKNYFLIPRITMICALFVPGLMWLFIEREDLIKDLDAFKLILIAVSISVPLLILVSFIMKKHNGYLKEKFIKSDSFKLLVKYDKIEEAKESIERLRDHWSEKSNLYYYQSVNILFSTFYTSIIILFLPKINSFELDKFHNVFLTVLLLCIGISYIKHNLFINKNYKEDYLKGRVEWSKSFK